ncbi:hypothetical protein OAG71_02510 [bacterium]|nr:hypothetical protein [bacterium]
MNIFLDTSIEVARTTHCKEIRQKIEEREMLYDASLVSSVVLKEFRQRVLKDARYVLDLIHRHGNISAVIHQVNRLPWQQARKQSICIGLIGLLFEDESEDSKLDRATLLLQVLIENGLALIEQRSLVIKKACSMPDAGITKKTSKRGKVSYDFGPPDCSKVCDCPIKSFLESKRDELQKILVELNQSSKLTKELEAIKSFVESHDSFEGIEQETPCDTVGDLLIALESSTVAEFMTLNIKESESLCRSLGQTLVWVKTNPDKEIEVLKPAQ